MNKEFIELFAESLAAELANTAPGPLIAHVSVILRPTGLLDWQQAYVHGWLQGLTQCGVLTHNGNFRLERQLDAQINKEKGFHDATN